jgi:hypothetical protein
MSHHLRGGPADRRPEADANPQRTRQDRQNAVQTMVCNVRIALRTGVRRVRRHALGGLDSSQERSGIEISIVLSRFGTTRGFLLFWLDERGSVSLDQSRMGCQDHADCERTESQVP